MITKENEMKAWKRQQLEYFTQYLRCFDEGTKEHLKLKKALSELEKSI